MLSRELEVPKKCGYLAGETSDDRGLVDGSGSEFLGDSYWSSIVYGEVHDECLVRRKKCFLVVTSRVTRRKAASWTAVAVCRRVEMLLVYYYGLLAHGSW